MKGTGARWLLVPRRPEAEQALCGALGLRPRLARLLVNRGIATPEAASAFLEATLSRHLRSPLLFRSMPEAAGRVADALRRGERIGIFGDYDVDGISGSALLLAFFRELGHDPVLYIPHRLREGYGVSDRGLRALAEQGARLVITVDCGGSSHAVIGRAQQAGIDVIVCDHHQVAGEPLPARAVLNPMEAEAGFPFRGLCGAGVAFYLLLGVRMRLREQGAQRLPDLRRYLDLVALGTVADLVPMLEENRVLVKHGLQEIAVTARPGLLALKAVGGVTAISTGAVAFRLAPRLNAGGRLADARRAVRLLVSQDSEEARRLAEELEGENRARREIEEEILRDALRQIERDPSFASRRTIVLGSPDWHPGVVGIAAARLVERFHRPAILVGGFGEAGVARGSCRSIPGVSIFECLRRCADLLESFGGHAMAGGLSLRIENLPALAERFEQVVASKAKPEDFVRSARVDDELSLAEIDDELLCDLERLEPFGPGNPEPAFLFRGLAVTSRRSMGDAHLRLFVRQGNRGMGCVLFGAASVGVEEGDRIDVIGIPERDDWNGGVRVRVHALRPAEV